MFDSIFKSFREEDGYEQGGRGKWFCGTLIFNTLKIHKKSGD